MKPYLVPGPTIIWLLMSQILGWPVCGGFGFAAPGAAACQTTEVAVGEPVLQNAAEEDQVRQWQSFFDTVVPDLIQQHQVPGITISVVNNGAIVFAKGYGFANLHQQTPVDPERSLFRIGSITKLFTWTAVMQMVERGRLDLDADVNDYLDTFQIPDRCGQPVTMRDLMGHAAGFEDRGLIGTLARNREGMIALDQYLSENLPTRVYPPGVASAYSNFGGALAGHIVSNLSGKTFAAYVQDQILQPLNMHYATAFQPPPNELLPYLASSYRIETDRFRPIEFGLLIPEPEGGISASATSMAQFMIAHLEGGRTQGNLILQPTTLAKMHRQSFTHDPRLDGWAHGFQESHIQGHRALVHGGSLTGFVSQLVMIPGHRIGLFVSCNSLAGSPVIRNLQSQFFERFLPAIDRPAEVVVDNRRQAEFNVAGIYAPCRSSHSTMTKIGRLMQAVSVSEIDESSVSFLGQRWTESAPNLYQSDDAEIRLAFRGARGSKADFVFLGPNAWQRLRWYELPWFQGTWLGICLLTFMVTILIWLSRYLIQVALKRPCHITDRRVFVGQLAAVLVSLLNLGFIIALAWLLSGDTSELEYGIPISVFLLLTVPWVAAAATIVLAFLATQIWRYRLAGITERIQWLVLMIFSFAFLGFLYFWNLLGWNY